MKLKNVSFLELHAEKLIALFAVLILLGVVYLYGLNTPNVVQVNNQPVTPGEVDRVIEAEAQRLSEQLRSDQLPEELAQLSVPPYRDDFVARVNTRPAGEQRFAVSLAQRPAFGALEGIGTPTVPFYEPTIPAPVVAATRADLGTIDEIELTEIRGLAARFGDDGPYDAAWVSLLGHFDLEAMLGQFRHRPDDDRRSLPEEWYERTFAIVDVQAERLEMRTDGTWPEYGDADYDQYASRVAPMPGHLLQEVAREMPETIGYEEGMEYLRMIHDHQEWIVQPEFYALARDEWVAPDPDFSLDEEDAEIAEAVELRREIRDKERMIENLESRIERAQEQSRGGGQQQRAAGQQQGRGGPGMMGQQGRGGPGMMGQQQGRGGGPGMMGQQQRGGGPGMMGQQRGGAAGGRPGGAAGRPGGAGGPGGGAGGYGGGAGGPGGYGGGAGGPGGYGGGAGGPGGYGAQMGGLQRQGGGADPRIANWQERLVRLREQVAEQTREFEELTGFTLEPAAPRGAQIRTAAAGGMGGYGDMAGGYGAMMGGYGDMMQQQQRQMQQQRQQQQQQQQQRDQPRQQDQQRGGPPTGTGPGADYGEMMRQQMQQMQQMRGGYGPGARPQQRGGPSVRQAPTGGRMDRAQQEQLMERLAQLRGEELPDPAAELDAVADDAEAEYENTLGAFVLDPPELDLWVNDFDAEPGKSYRYRLRVSILNPMWNKGESLPEGQREAHNERFVLTSDWGEWSAPVQVEPMQHFFVLGSSPTPSPGRVEVEVWKFYNGMWESHEFRLQPGDPIGRPNDEVDFTTGAYIVDLDFDHPVADRRGNLAQRTTRVLYMKDDDMASRLLEHDRDSEKREWLKRRQEYIQLSGL